MKTRLTMKQMVREIFLDATQGQRTAANFLDGSIIIESVPSFFYRWFIEQQHTEVANGTKSASEVLKYWYFDLRERESNRAQQIASILETFIR